MDYKHRVPGNRSRKLRRPDRTGLVAVVMVGIATVAVAVWMMTGGDGATEAPAQEEPKTTQLPAPSIKPLEKAGNRPQGSGDAKEGTTAASKPAQTTPAPTPSPKPQEPRFSFYKILPEKEVIIAESEIKTIKREETQGKKLEGSIYMIQAGSFTRLEDAEKLKGQLSHLKVKAKIESVKIENADWHRVKIGPFDSLVNADRVRVYLRSNKIDSVVHKSTRQ